MKVVFTINPKTGEIDWFVREGNNPGPTPPIVNPPAYDKPKDTGPPEPKKPEPRPS